MLEAESDWEKFQDVEHWRKSNVNSAARGFNFDS